MKLNEEYFILEHFKNSDKDITLKMVLQDELKHEKDRNCYFRNNFIIVW